ncbi:M18 family aminopeptidase [Ornithinimicrobium cavernae]|uniref:M18 family aminopeptidase n=1 Tax=Ornithinimicrobium cavernae TaxID=2666047 RepID=UPI000D69A334|nr:M18 family aminopeptidase [Ornithinimicrobium cavernae]
MSHPFGPDDVATRLADYLDASPSPFHAVESSAALLEASGFTRVVETDPTPTEPGRYLTIRGGSLIAWSTEADQGPATPFRVVGAHTDSPNLRIKPRPDLVRAGWQQLAVEIYGGPLLNTWLDRDLGLSGRVAVRGAGGVEGRLLLIDEPLLRVSQLAPHLDRTVHTEGLKLNPQQHLVPHWGQGETAGDFVGFVADHLGVSPGDVLGWDLMTHDLTPARRIGRDRDLLASARLDNLATSFAATIALATSAEEGQAGTSATVPVIALFDHEEVGSTTERGAQSTFLPSVLERIVLSRGGSREDYLRALAGTVIASGDMAHATNPNYADRHEAGHHVQMNGGPVLKINAQARYATDGLGAAAFRLACEQAGVPVQSFVTRTDLPCGSTVGPMTSALTGATTVDFGAPTLSMHSTREACGVADQTMYAGALAAFLFPA